MVLNLQNEYEIYFREITKFAQPPQKRNKNVADICKRKEL